MDSFYDSEKIILTQQLQIEEENYRQALIADVEFRVLKGIWNNIKNLKNKIEILTYNPEKVPSC
jgi:hypothetical protein